MNKPRPLMLMILDGWGWREECHGNALRLAKLPTWDALWKRYPHAFLTTNGEAVGLPAGTIGNSEVGHLNLGAGRVIFQDFTRINHAIATKTFFDNETLLTCCHAVTASGNALHLVGLCSDVGVHAHLAHLEALLDMAQTCQVKKVWVHAITDGRDSSPHAGKAYLERVERKVKQVGNACIATVTGRYYAMDRDTRWERTSRAWKAMVLGEGRRVRSSAEVMEASYAAGTTDEFIEPSVIMVGEQPIAKIENGDGVIFFNFRADRARQLTRALAFDDFAEFERSRQPKLSSFVCMTEYDKTFQLPVAFAPEPPAHILGKVLADASLHQLRIAETEKYAHVTYFFNGGNEEAFHGEDRCLIPSPRDVATYDQKPEMSALAVTEEVLKRIASDKYDVIILNFANPDMVGHTGNLNAAVRAVEVIDSCLAKIIPATLERGGGLVITADHGNCEEMIDKRGGPYTAHTMNPVPVLYVAAGSEAAKLSDGGKLCDIAPTLLSLLHLPAPPDMTGKSLVTFPS